MTSVQRRLLVACTALAAITLAAATWWLWTASELKAPPPSRHLLDRHGRFLTAVPTANGELGYWSIANLPPRVVTTTLMVEDHRFHWHPGIDGIAIVRAAMQNLRNGHRISGASTLAMQCARMQRPGPRTWGRKAIEAITALALTARNGRDAVLQHYLTVAPYGHQVHGIAYAARFYCNKPVADLSWAEVALLVALPQAPSRMDPYSALGRRRALQRADRILDILADADVITPLEHHLAVNELGALHLSHRPRRSPQALHAILRLETTLGDEPMTRSEEQQPLRFTTLDLELQRDVAWMAEEALWRWRPRGAGNVAIVVIDPHLGDVLAWVGSSNYFDRTAAGSIDYVAVPRSPGSTLKPFLYAAALDSGQISPTTPLDDLTRGAGGIGNADERFLGPMLPRFALANSRNVPAVNLLADLGLETTFDLLRRLGIHDGRRPARRYGLGLAIGSLPTTLERLVRATTALATDGRVRSLRWFRDEPCAVGPSELSEATTRTITRFLSDPVARLPSFPRMGSTEYRFPVAIKTGTSSRYHDAWTVAWTKKYLIGVWIGHPDHRPMHQLTGASSAAVVAREVLHHLHPDATHGLRDLAFPPPDGARPVRLCALTGRRATPACPRITLEWLLPGQEPVDSCQAHVVRAVDRRSGQLANSATPRADVELRTFVDLPSRYAAWQATAGLPRPPRPTRPRVPTARASLAPAEPHQVRIITPEDGTTVVRDPETPPALSTLALHAVADPPAQQIVWYVDGRPYQMTEAPHIARWPLTSGTHSFEARVPVAGIGSRVVTVSIQ